MCSRVSNLTSNLIIFAIVFKNKTNKKREKIRISKIPLSDCQLVCLWEGRSADNAHIAFGFILSRQEVFMLKLGFILIWFSPLPFCSSFFFQSGWLNATSHPPTHQFWQPVQFYRVLLLLLLILLSCDNRGRGRLFYRNDAITKTKTRSNPPNLLNYTMHIQGTQQFRVTHSKMKGYQHTKHKVSTLNKSLKHVECYTLTQIWSSKHGTEH